MINDLPYNLNCESILFADDTSLLSSMHNPHDLTLFMDHSLCDASDWFEVNGFKLNNNKTQRILFSLSYTSDELVSQAKLLGIILDSKLNWADHISYVCNRLSRVLYLLCRLKSLVSKDYLKYAYFAFFYSILSYGIHIWGNGFNVSKILILQKKALRIITSSSYDAHCKPLFQKTSILTVINQYIYKCLIITKVNLSNQALQQHLHNYSTRNNHLIVTPNVRLAKSKKWFNVIAIDMFNRLPRDAHSVSLIRFKVVLKSWLALNPFYNIQEFLQSNINIVF